MSNEWRLLKSGTLTGAFAMGLLALCTMGVSAVLARTLPQQDLGGYYLLQQAVTILAVVAGLGTSNSLQRLLAVPAARDDWSLVRAVLGRAAGLWAVGLPLVAAALAVGWGPLVERGLDAPTLAPLWALAVPLVATQLADEITSVYFRGTHRTRLGLFLLNLPRQMLFLVALVVLWQLGRSLDLRGVVWLRVAVTALAALGGIGLVVASLTRVRGTPREAPPSLAALARVSLPMMVHMLAAALLGGLDLWILGMFAGAGEVGLYGAMAQLAALLVMPVSAIGLVLPPRLATMHAEGRTGDMEALLRRTSTLSAWAVGVLFVPYLVAGRTLIDWVFGPGFERGYGVLVLLAAAQAYGVYAGSPGWALQMTGHQQALMRVTLAMAAVKAAAVWVAASKGGAVEVAAASAVVTAVLYTGLMVVARRRVGVRTWAWLNPLRALAPAPPGPPLRPGAASPPPPLSGSGT